MQDVNPRPMPLRPPSRVAYFWPLIGLAALGVFWVVLGFAGVLLDPISDTAHTIIYFTNVFVLIPSLMFLGPVLVLIQVALLGHLWRHRQGSAA
jgi:hypothetical protein